MFSMKRILSIITIILAFFSCNLGRETKGANGYQIKAKVSNCTAKTVLLDELSTQGFNTLDTATIDEKGNFTFTGNTKEPLFCALRFDANLPSEKRIFIVLDSNTSFKLEADYNALEKYKIKGSKDCEQIQALLAINSVMEEKLKVLDAEFASYDANNIPDSVAKNIRAKYDVIVKEQEASIDKFITENDGFANYFAGLFMMQAPPIPMLKKIDTKGMKKYANSKYAITLHDFVLSKQSTSIGVEAPDLNLEDVNGQKIALSSLRGQYVMIDFWASWCGPCRRENPNNVALYNKYHSKGFEIYGVSLDDNKDKWVNAIAADKLTWKHVSDLGGWSSSAAKIYNVSSIPQTFLLDKEGKIIAIGLRGEQLTQKLEELFGK